MILNLPAKLAHAAIFLCLLPMGICSAQEEERAAKKTQTIDVQILVTDGKGSPLDNVQVLVKWGERETESQKAVTNSSGVANLKEVPQETVTIRLTASGYKRVAPSVNLKTEKQPIKLSLDKESPHITQ